VSAQIKEALAALELMRRESDDWHRVRSALEAAQQEAEAWEAIEEWCEQDKNTRDIAMGPQSRADGWYLRLLGRARKQAPFVGRDRLEALTKAAAWCRAELAK
jgi:hypothetical protein